MAPLEIACNRRTMRNFECSVDRFDRRGMVECPVVGDEVAQRATAENSRGRSDLLGVGGIDFGGECIEEIVEFIAIHVRLSRRIGAPAHIDLDSQEPWVRIG